MVRQRGRSADKRMDAAIDHFTQMGYRKAEIRSTVNKLRHKDLYGEDGWPLLEDNCYYVVQEALLEKEQEKLLLQEQKQQQEEEEEAQQQEAAMQEAPLQNEIVEVHNEVPSEAVLSVEEPEEVVPMIIKPPALKATLLPPATTGTGRTRPPCYGWISESETESDSDYEEQPADQQHEVDVPSPGGDLLGKRKRVSRWDVK